MTDPRFSVVVAAYNAERTIAESIDSVLAQSHQDFEIVVVDDGSSDDTLKIVLQYAEAHEKIFVVSQTNQGVSAARNRGVSIARGTLIAFLDADDVWHADKLARHDALHASDPMVEASFARIAFCPDRTDGPLRPGRTRSSVPEGYCDLEDVVIENAVCTMSNLVIERDVFLELGGFKRSMRYVEDQDLLARVVGYGHLLRGIPETLVGYRMSNDGLSCDFDAMFAAWKELADRWSHVIDVRRGEALYCRYLARRALRAGSTMETSRNFVRIALDSDRKAFFSGGARGVLTAGATVAGSAMPARARSALFA
ncbi:glycosyltransferase family 2 protein [Alteriqipengyuania sp. 357]